MDNNSENLKKAVDDFGRLSFMLESYVKLIQTGDHKEVAQQILKAASDDAWHLATALQNLCPTPETIDV